MIRCIYCGLCEEVCPEQAIFLRKDYAIGRIPVIGDLLVGEEGSGIFAATYRLKGPLDDPDVSVNPLAALAPGFLRNLFGAIADGVTGKAGSPPTGTDPKPDFNR